MNIPNKPWITTCGYTHKDNRPTQAEFVCRRCGHTDNADHNAAAVIARRGVKKVLSGEPLTEAKKKTGIFRAVGPERSELTPGETEIRRNEGNTRIAHRSMSQELSAAMLETTTTTRSV